MTVFFSQLINGLSLGSIYALIALGYSMVYGIILLLNFAHGDIIMVGAYMSWFVMNQLGLGPVTAVCATIIVCTLMFLIGCLYTMSQAAFSIKGIWFDFANGVSFPIFGDFMEFLTDRLMIPLCALGVCIFTGWIWKPANAVHEIELDGKPFKLAKVYSVLVKYVAPISILLIIVASFVTGTTLS